MKQQRHKGLFSPDQERDSCGFGLIAHIHGEASHRLVKTACTALDRMTHRGAVGADPLDGDGAGLMIQMPDAYYREICDFDLPKPGEYSAGIVFLPQDEACREACIATLDRELTRVGCRLLGWREIQTDSSTIGRNARSVEPRVMQIFVGLGEVEAHRFELMLYLARKRAERLVIERFGEQAEDFYLSSMSGQTLVYKGMFLAPQLFAYYPDLSDSRVVSALALVHQRYSTNTFPTWDLAHPFRFLCQLTGSLNLFIEAFDGNIHAGINFLCGFCI